MVTLWRSFTLSPIIIVEFITSATHARINILQFWIFHSTHIWDYTIFKFNPDRHHYEIPACFKKFDTFLIIARRLANIVVLQLTWWRVSDVMTFPFISLSVRETLFRSKSRIWRWFIAYFNFIRGFGVVCALEATLVQLLTWDGGWNMLIVVRIMLSTWIMSHRLKV